MEKFARVEDFYNEVIKAFVNNVSNENKERFAEAYRKYLHDHYDEYFSEAGENDFDNIAMMCISGEKVTNISKSELDKGAILFPDKEYLLLENISLELAHFARLKKQGKKINISKSKEEYRKALTEQFEKVGELFRYSAEKMLSEAILDLEFIFGREFFGSFRNQ